MRHHQRNPVDLPIEIYSSASQPRLRLRNYSFGGLCCTSPRQLALGTRVEIDIPDVVPPSHHGIGIVVWCREQMDGQYEVGIRLATPTEAFASRIAAQLGHIERYRHRVWEIEERDLSLEEAAYEWITEYAQRFPPDAH